MAVPGIGSLRRTLSESTLNPDFSKSQLSPTELSSKRLFPKEAAPPSPTLASRVTLFPSKDHRISHDEIKAVAAATFQVDLLDTDLELLKTQPTGSEIAKISPSLTLLGERFFVLLDKTINLGADKIVYAGIDLNTGLPLAIPILTKEGKSKERLKNIRNEITILSKPKLERSPYVVAFHGSFEDIENIYLIEEHCSGGDLHDYMGKLSALDRELLCSIALEAAKAIEDLHERGFAHSDIKPENILIILDEEGRFKGIRLCDFAYSTPINKPHPTLCGTPVYLAPERLGFFEDKLLKHRDKSDVWSLSVIIHLLLGGDPSWFPEDEGLSLEEEFHHVLNFFSSLLRKFSSLEAYIPEHLRELLGPALIFNSENRCTSKELRERVEELFLSIVRRKEELSA